MKLILSIFITVILCGCKNNGNYDKAPASWKTFKKTNSLGIANSTVKFKYPDNWFENATAITDMFPEYVIIFPKKDLTIPNTILRLTFMYNTSSTINEFIDNMIIPTLKCTNKKSILLNGYNAFSFDVPSENNEKVKMYIIENGKSIVGFNFISSNNDIFEKTKEDVDGIIQTIVIE